jgi:hypothetical protein
VRVGLRGGLFVDADEGAVGAIVARGSTSCSSLPASTKKAEQALGDLLRDRDPRRGSTWSPTSPRLDEGPRPRLRIASRRAGSGFRNRCYFADLVDASAGMLPRRRRT